MRLSTWTHCENPSFNIRDKKQIKLGVDIANTLLILHINIKEDFMQTNTKRVYTTPKLTVHGNVEEITKGCDKVLGLSDGFTFQGQAIMCTS